MVKKGTAIPLMSFGVLDEQGNVVRDPNFKDLPTVPEVYEQPRPEAVGCCLRGVRRVPRRRLHLPEGSVGDRRDSRVRAEVPDRGRPELKNNQKFEQARQADLGDYPVYRGDQVEGALSKAFNISDSVKQYVLEMLKTKYDTTVQ